MAALLEITSERVVRALNNSKSCPVNLLSDLLRLAAAIKLDEERDQQRAVKGIAKPAFQLSREDRRGHQVTDPTDLFAYDSLNESTTIQAS